jgi:hypothetical protein
MHEMAFLLSSLMSLITLCHNAFPLLQLNVNIITAPIHKREDSTNSNVDRTIIIRHTLVSLHRVNDEKSRIGHSTTEGASLYRSEECMGGIVNLESPHVESPLTFERARKFVKHSWEQNT